MNNRYVILDIETTGIERSKGHRIIEFAALEMIDNKLTGNQLHFYFNPEISPDCNISAAEKIHGLTMDFLKDKPKFIFYVDEINEFISDAELIIHNAPFDIKFLTHEFELCGKELPIFINILDTFKLAKSKYPGTKYNLSALCDKFGIDIQDRNYHGALLDCHLLYNIYLNLKGK